METLKELPEGKKFFPLSLKDPSPSLLETFATIFSLDYYNAMLKVSEISSSGINYNGMNPSTFRGFLNCIKFHSNSEITGYPIFECTSMGMHLHIHYTNTKVSRVIKHAACVDRMESFSNMPTFKGMLFSYDPQRVGFIIYNAPYEDDLVKTKEFSKVNKLVKTSIEESLANLDIYKVLGDDMKISEEYRTYSWHTFKDKTNNIVKEMLKYLQGDTSWEVTWKLAIELGVGTGERVYSASSGRSPGTYLKLTNKPKVSIPAIARRRLMYHLGAYELPEDYMSYFE